MNNCPEVKSIKETKRLVVFLHGYGSDGNDLIALAPIMQRSASMHDCHFISPHGIEPLEYSHFGRQWFSLEDRSVSAIQKKITGASDAILDIISAVQKKMNLNNSNTIIMGFSQGAMIALYLALTQSEALASVVCFSGRLIPPAQCINHATPACLIHGTADDIINISEMHNTKNYLAQNNITCQVLEIPDLTHAIDSQAIQFAVDFVS